MKNTKGIITIIIPTIILSVLLSLTVVYLYPDLFIPPYGDTSQDYSQETQQQSDEIYTEYETTLTSVVANSIDKVVSIVATKDVPKIERYYERIDPFGGLFGGGFLVPRYVERGTEKVEVGGGTGFFVTEDGYIVTNKHVVSDTDASYTVITSNNKKYKAEVVTRDTVYDIAVLKIEPKDEEKFPYFEFGDSSKIKLGQPVIAIGNALGEFSNTVSAGIVSGLYRDIVAKDQYNAENYLDGLIQSDVALNPGNSGGPLIDLRGKVIGVNVAVADSSKAENISFSIPSNAVAEIVDDIKTTGKIVRPYLGIRYMYVTKEVAESNLLPYDYGVIVVRGSSQSELAVIPGSPADKAGIRENDVILEVDGEKIDKNGELVNILSTKEPGDKITLKVYSKGEVKEVEVTLEEAPKNLFK